MIEFKHVNYQYQNSNMQFDFSIQAKEHVAIIGPSGAGKSTLLSLIAGFIYPNSGEIWLAGNNQTVISPNKRPVSMLFQENNLFSHLTVEQNIALGISTSLKLNANQKDELFNIVERVGLQHNLTRYPEQLSGGQKQRVAIARCLVQHRSILLLDEPFSSLDPKLRQEMMTLVQTVCHEFGLTVLMVSHQIDEICQQYQRCLVIINGMIQFDGTFQQLFMPKHKTLLEQLGLMHYLPTH